MRRRRLFTALIAGAVGFGPMAPPRALWAEEPDGPVLTRDAKFAIPVEAAAGDPAQAEVRLYVSDDAGKSWKLNRRAKTPVESFEFAATADKEYWFCVRSADATGRETTTEPMSPELRVAVDSTPPKIDLEASRNGAGHIVIDWKIDDSHAAPDTLKWTYRSVSGGTAARAIVPLRSKRQGDDHTAVGQLEFRPDDAGAVVVRAETTDRAENRSSIEVTIEEALGPAAADLPKTAGAALSPPTATMNYGGSAAYGSSAYAPPAIGTAGSPQAPPAAQPNTTGPPISTGPTNYAPTPSVPTPTSVSGATAAGPTQLKPPVGGRATNGFTAGESPATGQAGRLPSAAPGGASPMRDPSRPTLVNSTSFELDYDVGPGAVTNVEVWGTRDEGRTWVLLGPDEDRASPTAVSVDRAGMYGFTIVVDSATAPARRPRPGDAPEIRIGVDLTIPTVRLTTAEPDADDTPCRLKINWEAKDDNLGPQAVSLSYAGSPAGPWLPLAAGVPNDGGYVCSFDPQGPDQAYLRIEVRDEAGNLGTFTTSTSIPIEKRPVTFHFAGAKGTAGKKAGPKWFHVLR